MKLLSLIAIVIPAVLAQDLAGCAALSVQNRAIKIAACVTSYSQISACTNSFPIRVANDNVCCPTLPSCILAPSCGLNQTYTPPAIKRCIEQAPTCAAGTTPGFSLTNNCCPTCWPRPSCDFSSVPVCAAGVFPVPVPSTGCPSCKPASGDFVQCSASDLLACQNSFNSLPDCAAGVTPQRVDADGNPQCCLNCKPAVPKACNATSAQTCQARYSSLPDCSAGTKPPFDPNTCCVSCKQPVPADQRPPATGDNKCTTTQIQACVNSAATCQTGQVPERDPMSRCCPTCVRPQRRCNHVDVAWCRANTPVCAASEKPMPVENDPHCCPTCLLPPPSCTPACASTLKCERRLMNGTVTTGCYPKRTIRRIIKLSSALATAAAKLRAVGDAAFTDFLREILSRWCDQNANTDNCKRWYDSFVGISATTVACTAANAGGSDASLCFDVSIDISTQMSDPTQVINPTPDGTVQPQSVEGIMFASALSVDASVDAALTDSDSSSGTTSSDPNSASSALAPTLMTVLSIFLFALVKF